MGVREEFNQERQDDFDCCGCSRPWLLFDELLARAAALEAALESAESDLKE